MINLLVRNSLLMALALFILSPSTQAATWYSLDIPGGTNDATVEVDIESMSRNDNKHELVTRISFAQPQKEQNISFQSVIAELQISCENDLDIWKSVKYFERSQAKGILLRSEKFGTAGIPKNVLKILPDKAWVTLQKSACGRNTALFP